jgi:RNA polymerase sigma-70 factor (ECF subfamily)
LSDEQLLALIAEGDGQALEELYSRYARKVYAIARHLLADRKTCEEVVQDVFTRVWTTRSFDPNQGLVDHWICVVARRVAIDYLRKMRHTVVAMDIAAVEAILPDTSTKREMDSRLLKADFVVSMATLRREERIIIELAYFKGYTLAEVASILGIPEGTVKTRLHRALHTMRANFDITTVEVFPRDENA